MKKLSLFAASVSTALVCAAVPASFSWSPTNVTFLSLDTAEARVGRPLTATSVAGVNRRVQRRAYRRGAAGLSLLGPSELGPSLLARISGGPDLRLRSAGLATVPGRSRAL